MLKKISTDILLVSMFLPWAIWVTVSLFASETAHALTENNYKNIIEKIQEIKDVLKSGK